LKTHIDMLAVPKLITL